LRVLTAALILAIGLTLVATAAFRLARVSAVAPAHDFGATAGPEAGGTTGPAAVGTAGRAAGGTSRPTAGGTSRPTASGTSGSTVVTAERPVSLAIPALRVTATVVPVVNTGGVLGVPDDPTQVGWWSSSALAGSRSGTTVIDGHVDSAATGPGALFRIASLRTADRIVVTTATGDRRSYAVSGLRVYPKTAGLPADIFALTGAPRLVLISCGGPFDRPAGSYLDNIVVFAVPT
jgi:sortase family protein